MNRHLKLSAVFVVLSLSLGGCPKAYFWTVAVDISPQVVDTLRSAVRKLPGLEGQKRVTGGDPNCTYYDKRLSRSGALVAVDECHSPRKDSAAGWSYRVTINTFEGGRPEVGKEIDTFIEDIHRIIEAHVPDANPTVETHTLSI